MTVHHGIVTTERKWYGQRRDHVDVRDLLFHADLSAPPPTLVDLRADCPPIMDQGNLGSCTAHGICVALRYLLVRKGGPRDHRLSRLQLYFDERVIEGTIASDAGAEIRDGIKCAAKIGVAHETLWPYVISKYARTPSPSVYRDAAKFIALRYERVDVDPLSVKAAIANNHPVVIGFAVYESFESDAVANTGMVPLPNPRGEYLLGGHCVAIVGYGQHSGYFTCQNSWGADWGDKGFFYMPEGYITPDYCDDFWIVPSVTGITIGSQTFGET